MEIYLCFFCRNFRSPLTKISRFRSWIFLFWLQHTRYRLSFLFDFLICLLKKERNAHLLDPFHFAEFIWLYKTFNTNHDKIYNIYTCTRTHMHVKLNAFCRAIFFFFFKKKNFFYAAKKIKTIIGLWWQFFERALSVYCLLRHRMIQAMVTPLPLQQHRILAFHCYFGHLAGRSANENEEKEKEKGKESEEIVFRRIGNTKEKWRRNTWTKKKRGEK